MESTDFISEEKLIQLGFNNSKILGFGTGVFVKNDVKISRHGEDFINNTYSMIHGDNIIKIKNIGQLKSEFTKVTGCKL